ncbi:MAG: VWA-like domain-containing protein [Chloroflexota bacterium]|nr:VWA-like domain-containing protein [Chloroflexota bacterium]
MSHLLGKVLAALPPALAGLFETGLLAIEIRDGPEARRPYAMTVYRRGSYTFTIVLDAHAVAVASRTALQAIVRHELGHIVMGHFGPEHEACRLPCNTLAEEAEVNSFLSQEEREAMEDALTVLALRSLARRLGPTIAMLLPGAGLRAKVVDPDHVRAMAGLSADLPPRWRWLHPLLHPMPPDQEPPDLDARGTGGPGTEVGTGGEGRLDDGDPCGGVQVEEGAMEEAAGVAAAIAASPRAREALGEASRRGWGSEPGGNAIEWHPPLLPRWAQEVVEWVRKLAHRTWALRRIRHRPRIDFLRATGVYRPDRGYDRVRTAGEVTFVVDASGSMIQDVHYAHPAISYLLHQGIAVRFICGDVQVEVDTLLRPGDQIPAPKGCGGTDICPLMERAASYRPHGICVYTDAAIPRWPPQPEGAEVLWVVPEGITPPYGQAVHWRPEN